MRRSRHVWARGGPNLPRHGRSPCASGVSAACPISHAHAKRQRLSANARHTRLGLLARGVVLQCCSSAPSRDGSRRQRAARRGAHRHRQTRLQHRGTAAARSAGGTAIRRPARRQREAGGGTRGVAGLAASRAAALSRRGCGARASARRHAHASRCATSLRHRTARLGTTPERHPIGRAGAAAVPRR